MSKGQGSALWLSTIATIISFTVWTMISQAAPIVKNMYQLNETELSVLIATPVLLGALMRIPIGIVSDRYGGRKIFTLTMFVLIYLLVGAGYTTI
ncbi:MFS transporter [Pseudalkalibacillus decolorationis]|uniref:MFS transporter n=1 Tax=Pseudalkalibacillus decolorationis TaxID=163879 RepID=UPI00214897B3|nr:MFS transporter [Pseudalkalibacillus decolorationis]